MQKVWESRTRENPSKQLLIFGLLVGDAGNYPSVQAAPLLRMVGSRTGTTVRVRDTSPSLNDHSMYHRRAGTLRWWRPAEPAGESSTPKLRLVLLDRVQLTRYATTVIYRWET